MKDFPIQNFGTKLMVASRSINNIPDHFNTYAQNARIYDGGIGPRRGKSLLTSSTLGTKNMGGFIMNGNLFQVAKSKIYQIDLTTGVQTEKATLGYDARIDSVVYGTNIAILASSGQPVKVYDGATTVTAPATVPASNSGIVEYCRGFTFLASGNVLYVSRPITAANPEYSYDWTGSGSQNITYDSDIKALKGTMNGLYVFTANRIDFLGANALQNVAGSATFISTPIGESSYPVSNACVAASGDKIFYLSKNSQVMTVNWTPGVTNSQIGELSARPVISFKEFLDTLDTTQAYASAHYNENEKTVNFHAKKLGSGYNDTVVVYDLVNDTWAVDTGKNYGFVIRDGEKYWGFSDVNSSIYRDDYGYTDAGSAIGFKIVTQNLLQGNYRQKLYQGLYTQGAINRLTDLDYSFTIDGDPVFSDTVSGSIAAGNATEAGAIGDMPIGDAPIGGNGTFSDQRFTFDIVADQGRVFQAGKRCQFEITSSSQIQDFVIDRIGVRADVMDFVDTSDKW